MVWKKDVRAKEDKFPILGDKPDNYGSIGVRKKQKKPEEYVPKINVLHLFKYATQFDITLMVIGTIAALFSGMTYPILGFYFGGMTNVFIIQAKNGLLPDEVAQKMETYAVANAEPTKMLFTQNTEPVEYRNDNKILYKVVYTLTEFFTGNLTNDDLWRNDTLDGAPLTESEFHETLNRYFIIFLVMGLLTFISGFIQTMTWEYVSEHQVHTIRKVYFAQILRQDISWYDKNEDGNLPNKLSDDLERMREGTGHKFVMIIQYLSTFVSGIIVGLYVNARMTLITLCVGPFIVGLTAYGAKFASSQVAREQQKYAKAGAVADESLSNIKTVTAYGGQSYESKRYYDALEEGRIFAMKRYDLLTVCIGFTFFFMYGAYGLGFWYGAGLVQEGLSSPGSVFTVFFSVIIGAFTIGQALPFLNIVAASVGVSSSIQEIINRKITIDPYSKTGRKPIRMEGHIEFRNVHFSYPSRPTVKILNGLTLDIQPGKTTAIVGSSGAGKSTIVSLIQRLYDPSDGQVCVDGIPLTDLNVRWLRSHIGLVSQEPVLFGVSIAENISYGRTDVTEDEVIEAAKRANAHNFIITLPEKYNTLVGDTGSQLSGGQKQRIAIARALVRDPSILLLDEATSALDAHSEGIVQDTLTEVMVGRTTVIVAHRLSTIKNADIIYAMKDGKLFESGTHEELMEKQSLYYSLVMSQTNSKDERTVDNGETSDSSLMGSIESEEELGNLIHARIGFETVMEEDNFEDKKSVDLPTALKDDENDQSVVQEKVQLEKTEVGKTKITSELLDEKVSKSYKTENGVEYEIIVVEKTVEELYNEDSHTDLINLPTDHGAVKSSNEKLDSEENERKFRDGLRRRSKEHTGGSRRLTNSQKKKIPLTEPEPCEKEITVWEVLQLQKPEWGWLIFGIMGSVGVGLVTPLFALFYGQIFYVFTLEGEALSQARTFWTAMFAALALYCSSVYSAQCKGLTESSEKTLLRMRGLVFENILRQPVAWFDFEASSPGILVNRLARNIPLIKAAAGVRTGQVLSAMTTIIAAFSIAFLSGWKLSLTIVICVPIILLVSYKQAVLLKKNQMRDALSMDLAGQVASECVRHIRTVQALGQEILFTQIYSNHLIAPYKEAVKQAFLYALLYAVMQGIVLSMYAAAFRIGGYLVEIHEMDTTNIYRVFFALSFCATSVGQSFMYLQDYNKARHATRILNYLLTRKSEIDPSNTAGVRPDITGTVEFRRVQFVYPTRPDILVLRRLSFKIEAGKTLALVGESGCGKSTVISLLERFHDPISGVILLDGYDIRTLNLNYLRSKIGIVNQEPILFDCSIRDNIAYGALALQKEVTFDQIQIAAKTANIHDFVMTLPERYDTVVGERGVQLSGGQKQRVAIARALIRDPKILLLDEATSALDTENEKIVQAALDRAKEGRTCIVVAHRLSTIQNADLICVVLKGEIVESGTHKELVDAKGHYYELTQRQVL